MKLVTAKQKLKTLLKDNLNRRFILSKKGKLSGNRLHASKTSDRLFSQRLETSGKRYHLEILFDASGSMAFQNGTGTNSSFYRGLESVKELVKLFNGVIDISIHFFNVREWQMTTKEILKFDLETVDTETKCFKYMGQDNMKLDKETGKFVTLPEGERGPISAAQGNREIAAIQNSFERLSKLKGERICIILGDGMMHIDNYQESSMIENNIHVYGKPVKKYNTKSAKEICKGIEKNGVHLLGIGLGRGQLNYISDNTKIRRANELYEVVINFLKKKLK